MGTFVDTVLGSGINYVTLAVPFFFLLIGVELIVGRLQRKELYRFNDSINDLSCGIVDQIVAVFLKGLLFAGYLFLFEHVRLLDIEQASPAARWGAAIALLFGVDFCFYWFHRISHEYAAPWAAHVVHHQSEEYNLAVALRQSAFESCFSWIFYLPLAVIGFPPVWYLSMSAINLLYQFWVHTEAIGRLGPLEWIFNTPSHHRVHHARNLQYLDKNYAGMFIIWDRLFGTFELEVDQPVYGITRPLRSWNPLWANLYYWIELAQDAYRAPRWRDKIKIWFMPLGWTPPGLPERPRAQQVTRTTLTKYNPVVPRGLSLYVFAHFVLVVALAVSVLVLSDQKAPRAALLGPALLVFWSLADLGAVLELKKWALVGEIARLLVVVAVAVRWLPENEWRLWGIAGAVIVALVSAGWLAAYRREFFAGSPREISQPATQPATGSG